jgi:hypothetical protein
MSAPASLPTDPPDLVEQLARRFPLVPRHRPVLPPLAQQLADITNLARTPPDHPHAAARIAAAHNKAALIASNCGHHELADTLCWQHHHRYTHHPWTATTARRALEPVVNIARLHIRAGHPDTAIEALESLLSAVGHGGVAEIDGNQIDLGARIATSDDRAELRRWVWSVTLAEGVRALARAGRWDDALAHAHHHRGIGATLLDGRQIAVIAHSLRGDHADAATLLADSLHTEPWQRSVAYVLDLLIHQRARTTTPRNAWRLVAPQQAEGQGSAIGVYRLDVQLTALELVDDTARSTVLAELTRITAGTTDAALARTVLTHPARRHLPAPLLEQLATVHALATTPTTAGSLHTTLTNALAGLAPGRFTAWAAPRSRDRKHR